ncbi:hypothetical protein BGX38DRAFT_164463, partial [Terfezia claveryi]
YIIPLCPSVANDARPRKIELGFKPVKLDNLACVTGSGIIYGVVVSGFSVRGFSDSVLTVGSDGVGFCSPGGVFVSGFSGLVPDGGGPSGFSSSFSGSSPSRSFGPSSDSGFSGFFPPLFFGFCSPCFVGFLTFLMRSFLSPLPFQDFWQVFLGPLHLYMSLSAMFIFGFLSMMWTVPSLESGPGWVGMATTEVKTRRVRARIALESCILMEFMQNERFGFRGILRYTPRGW